MSEKCFNRLTIFGLEKFKGKYHSLIEIVFIGSEYRVRNNSVTLKGDTFHFNARNSFTTKISFNRKSYLVNKEVCQKIQVETTHSFVN